MLCINVFQKLYMFINLKRIKNIEICVQSPYLYKHFVTSRQCHVFKLIRIFINLGFRINAIFIDIM